MGAARGHTAPTQTDVGQRVLGPGEGRGRHGVDRSRFTRCCQSPPAEPPAKAGVGWGRHIGSRNEHRDASGSRSETGHKYGAGEDGFSGPAGVRPCPRRTSAAPTGPTSVRRCGMGLPTGQCGVGGNSLEVHRIMSSGYSKYSLRGMPCHICHRRVRIADWLVLWPSRRRLTPATRSP